MATSEEQLTASMAMMQQSNTSIAALQNQIVVLTNYQNSVNTTPSIPQMVTGNTDPNTFYVYAANGVINASNATGGFIFPSGNNETRPSPAINGTVRYNSTTGSLEIYTNKWQDVGTGAAGGSGGGAISGIFYENSNTITESFTSTPGKNIQSAGPIILSDPTVVVTIANGSVWTVH